MADASADLVHSMEIWPLFQLTWSRSGRLLQPVGRFAPDYQPGSTMFPLNPEVAFRVPPPDGRQYVQLRIPRGVQFLSPSTSSNLGLAEALLVEAECDVWESPISDTSPHDLEASRLAPSRQAHWQPANAHSLLGTEWLKEANCNHRETREPSKQAPLSSHRPIVLGRTVLNCLKLIMACPTARQRRRFKTGSLRLVANLTGPKSKAMGVRKRHRSKGQQERRWKIADGQGSAPSSSLDEREDRYVCQGPISWAAGHVNGGCGKGHRILNGDRGIERDRVNDVCLRSEVWRGIGWFGLFRRCPWWSEPGEAPWQASLIGPARVAHEGPAAPAPAVRKGARSRENQGYSTGA
ncbi:hypothetical protein FDECE_11643 [Fusarium decemcellulare]|nr:hypothetical protein FDECE_11643 [Fusarium decemcellulare]